MTEYSLVYTDHKVIQHYALNTQGKIICSNEHSWLEMFILVVSRLQGEVRWCHICIV
jgi:hypothetical protein